MRTQEEIEREVMKTLESLDKIENIEASPFFYTRLQAKIQDIEGHKERSASLIFGAAKVRFTGVVALVVMNIFSMLFVYQTSQTSTDNRQTYVSEFADEYALTQDTIDLFE